MANALYDAGREGFLDGSYNWSTNAIKGVLVGTGYTPNLATDKFLSDIPSLQVIATSPSLAGKTEAAGVANATNLVFTAVSGAQCKYLVLYYDTGSAGSSRLIACIDTATGLPVTPNGGDITIAWDTGANKIFKL